MQTCHSGEFEPKEIIFTSVTYSFSSEHLKPSLIQGGDASFLVKSCISMINKWHIAPARDNDYIVHEN